MYVNFPLIHGTCSLGMSDATEEDGDEPLQGVLVHRVDACHVGDTEEENLGVDGHGNVLTAGHVNVSFCLLGHRHFRLGKRRGNCLVKHKTN